MADVRSKVVQTLGDLLLSNLEMAASFEEKTKEAAELQKKLAELAPKPKADETPAK